MSLADNSVKKWRNLAIKPDLHNISAYTKFGENALTFSQVIFRKQNYGHVWGKLLSKNDKFAH